MMITCNSSSLLPTVLTFVQPPDEETQGLEDHYLLLVEDNEDDAILTLRTLKKLNITTRVVTVKDGAEALDALTNSNNHPPCLVLLDLKLPKVDGSEVLRRLRADPSTTDLPVVVISSSKEELEHLKGQDLGAVDYVMKNYHQEGFTKSLERIRPYCP